MTMKQYQKEWHQKNKATLREKRKLRLRCDPAFKESFKKRHQQWVSRNKEKVNKTQRAYYHRNKERIKDAYVKNTYKVPAGWFKETLEKQNYSCAICKYRPKEGEVSLAVDHDHISLKVRGLLCKPCNTAIGLFRESIESLQKTIEYLKFFKGPVAQLDRASGYEPEG